MTTSIHHHQDAIAPATPIFKWPGGKRALLSQLLPFVPAKFGTYFEPFAGGAALFFALAPERAVVSDLCRPLMNAYCVVKNDVEALIGCASNYNYSRELFDEVRARNFDEGSVVERAADFLFANKTSFNGLFRVNTKGQYNTPFGKYTNPTICDADALRQASQRLQETALLCGDFADAVVAAEAGDLVYFNPPYDPRSSTSSFTKYNAKGFPWSEHVRLHEVALELRAKGVHVILSNADTPAVHELYKDFNIEAVHARRAINSNARKRGPVTELIVTG